MLNRNNLRINPFRCYILCTYLLFPESRCVLVRVLVIKRKGKTSSMYFHSIALLYDEKTKFKQFSKSNNSAMDYSSLYLHFDEAEGLHYLIFVLIFSIAPKFDTSKPMSYQGNYLSLS